MGWNPFSKQHLHFIWNIFWNIWRILLRRRGLICLYAICLRSIFIDLSSLQSQICLIGKSFKSWWKKSVSWWNQIFVCCQTEANLLPTNYSIKLQFSDSIKIKKMQEHRNKYTISEMISPHCLHCWGGGYEA